jgi:RNA polymerase sigma-70 factor (ECF subfamily)
VNDPIDRATAAFAEHRELLFAIAYRILGTVADTEDVLQDTWLAWAAADRDRIDNQRAYLVRIAVNEALARLRRSRRSREVYVGPWLPEPLVAGAEAGRDGAEHLLRAESVSLAMLVVLETASCGPTPADRPGPPAGWSPAGTRSSGWSPHRSSGTSSPA